MNVCFDINVDFIQFSLFFVSALSLSCFAYTASKLVVCGGRRSTLGYLRTILLFYVTVVYTLMLFDVIAPDTIMRAMAPRLGVMGLVSLMFIDTYRME